MSVRRVLRFTLAGLLAAAFAAPAKAYEPVLPVAPMPRAKNETRFEVELRFGAPHGIELRLQGDRLRQQGANLPPCCGNDCRQPVETAAVPVMPPPRRPDNDAPFGHFAVYSPDPPRLIVGGTGSCPAPTVISGVAVAPVTGCCPMPHGTRVVEVTAVEVCRNAHTTPANPMMGMWHRDIGLATMELTFTHDEMKLCIVYREGGDAMTCTVTGHYTLTKDGLVYGAITSADVDVQTSKRGEAAVSEIAEMSMAAQKLADQPFSFRVKSTSAGLMVSQVKMGQIEGMSTRELAVLGGLYKREMAARTSAATKPSCLTATVSGCAAGACSKPARLLNAEPARCADPVPCERVGVDFESNPPRVMLQPVPPTPACTPVTSGPPMAVPCPMPQPVRPVAGTIPSDPMKQMTAEAFGQLLQDSGVVRPVGGMTLPNPRCLEHYPQYFAPDPAFPLPRELASQEAPRCEACPRAASAPARPGITGKWFRDSGTKRCVVTVAADHMTITLTESVAFGGEPVNMQLTFTADYHLARDGMTAVGLITSVDLKCDGDMPEGDAEAMMARVGELQKAMEDKPFALTCRLYGDALVIGNVRMPTVPGDSPDQPGAYIGGRFTRPGDKPLPKLKAAKAPEPRPMMMSGPPPYALPLPIDAGPASLNLPLGPGFGTAPGLMLPPGSSYPVPVPVTLPVPASGHDLLPPQTLPTPPPLPVSRPVSRPSSDWTPTAPAPRALNRPAELPSMSEPTPPVPTMPEPVAPELSGVGAKPVQATDMTVLWKNRVAMLPGPTRGGAKGACLVGQVLLLGGPNLSCAPANGTLTVDVTDETPRATGQKPATPERWQFDKDTLGKLLTKDETFGDCYTVCLPWPAYTPEITKVRIAVRYDPDNGHTLYEAPTTVTLTPCEKPEPTMAVPVTPEVGVKVPHLGPLVTALDLAMPLNKAPGDHLQLLNFSMGLFGNDAATVPTMPEPVPPGPLSKAPAQDDPNIRMQRLLYAVEGELQHLSEDLRSIRTEWRRFWFNDVPGQIAPERIHGGIY